MSKHTPGPWKVYRIQGYIQVRGSTGHLIYERGEPEDEKVKARLMADAQLAASAPMLLNCAKTTIEAIMAIASTGTTDTKPYLRALESLRIAIHKAEGVK